MPRLALPPLRPHAPLLGLTLVAYTAFVWYCATAEATESERHFALCLHGATALAVGLASARLLFGWLTATWLFGTIWCAGALKFTYLELPVIAPDLQYFFSTDTAALFSRYPPILAACFGLFGVGPALLVWAWRRGPGLRFRARRLAAATALAALAVTAFPRGPFAALFDKPMWVAVNDESFITDFVTSFHDTQIHIPEAPPGTPALDWPAEAPDPTSPTPEVRPDIFAVLEESTFDPMTLAVCQDQPICRRAMFEPDAQTRAHGLLGVHTFGGGTWTAEFSLVTGLDHTLFGNAGLYAPYNLAPRVQSSLPKVLKAQGYRVVALYPTSADFINGRNAYRHYGFDRLYDGPDFGLAWRIEDQPVMELAWRLYEEERAAHPDTPIFFLVLTIHQHGPHMTPHAELPPPYDKPLFDPKLGEWLNLNLSNYLKRNADSDASLRWLETRALDRPEPTVVMHFGDHQPSFDGAINNLEKRLPPDWGEHTEWATYYMIRANFEPLEKTPAARTLDWPVLDLAFLGGLVLDVAGLPTDVYFQTNAALRARCRGRYAGCATSAIVDAYHTRIFRELKVLGDE